MLFGQVQFSSFNRTILLVTISIFVCSSKVFSSGELLLQLHLKYVLRSNIGVRWKRTSLLGIIVRPHNCYLRFPLHSCLIFTLRDSRRSWYSGSRQWTNRFRRRYVSQATCLPKALILFQALIQPSYDMRALRIPNRRLIQLQTELRR